MDLLTGLVSGGLQASMSADPNNPAVWSDYNGVMTAAGFRVDAEGARKISAWYRGRDILATSVAMMPRHVYRKLPNDGGREVASSHPLEYVVHEKPAPGSDAFQYWRQAIFDVIDGGWFYARITSGPRGFVDTLPRIDPATVTPERIKEGPLKGQWKFTVRDPEKGGQPEVLREDQVFYLRGAEGKGILQYARDSLGLGLVLDNYASKIFSRGSLNAGYVETPGPMPDEPGMRAFARQFVTQSGEWHFPKVIPFGAKFTTGQTLDPEKAQMILSRKFSVIDIARWLGLPAHMLNEVDTAGVTGLEQKGQEFVTFSLGGWLSLCEFAINDQLILSDHYFAEFTREALVRGDLEARAAADVAYVNAGIETPDEVRVRNNKPKMGGKAGELREPQNITGRGAYGGPQDNQRPGKTGTPDNKAEAIVLSSAARIIDKEIKTVTKLAVQHSRNQDDFAAAVTEFYRLHVGLVVKVLQLSQVDAEHYCSGQAGQALEFGAAAVTEWEKPTHAQGLMAWALESEAA
jgi:HK97 family phage portal protein